LVGEPLNARHEELIASSDAPIGFEATEVFGGYSFLLAAAAGALALVIAIVNNADCWTAQRKTG
jgi:hypothetical protein